jgi:tetratricopeptide (TPR) repeat protein
VLPEAQAAVDRGVIAAKEQEWDIAIQSFQEARKTAPNAPEVFYNLGLAESKIPGRELRAIAWFGAYLAVAPHASNVATVKSFIADLQSKSQENSYRIVQALQDADGHIPDTRINSVQGILTSTNGPDFDRMSKLGDVLVLWASFGNIDRAMQLDHRETSAGYSAKLDLVGKAQAEAGDIAGAFKTAANLSGPGADSDRLFILQWIASVQATAGDAAGAQATLNTSVKMASGHPEWGDFVNQTRQIVEKTHPASVISVSDWVNQLDGTYNLNNPIFLDLAGALKAPQQAIKVIYPGTDFKSAPEGMQAFNDLESVATKVRDEKILIDRMLRQQAKQQATP